MLVIPLASATYDDWIYPGDTIDFEDTIFNIEGPSSGEKISIIYDDVKLIVNEGDCEDTDHFRFCHIERAFDLEDHGKMDYKYDREVHHIHLNISQTGPKIEIDRSLDKINYVIDEKGTLTIAIKNSGIEDADSFKYIERIPKGLRMINTYEMTRIGESITWSGSIRSGETETLKLDFIAEDEVDTETVVNASYVYQGKIYNITSNELDYISSVYKEAENVDVTILSNQIKLGEEFDFEVKIENNDDAQDMIVDELNLSWPESFEFVRSQDKLAKESDTSYTWSDTIEPQSDKTITVTLKPTQEGPMYLIARPLYRINDLTYLQNVSKKFSVGATKVTGVITFGHKKFNRKLQGGLTDWVSFGVDNSDSEITYYNIRARTGSDYFEPLDLELATIDPDTGYSIQRVDYVAPFVTQKTSYKVNISGTYETNLGKEFNFTKTMSFSVEPVNFSAAIEITHVFDQNLTAGEQGTGTVSIESLVADRIDNILVIDDIGSLEQTGGVIGSRIVSLDPEESTTAYRYNYRGNLNDEITTTVKYDFGGNTYEIHKTSQINISGFVDPNATINNTNQSVNVSEVDKKAKVVVEEAKPSVVARILNGIGSVLKKILLIE